MQELEKEIKEAGTTVMNEVGPDPGIDHLCAVKTIDEVHKAGGKKNSFLSYCGGLNALTIHLGTNSLGLPAACYSLSSIPLSSSKEAKPKKYQARN